jgi:hypothetical protein
MDLVILMFRLAVWLSMNGGGGGPQTEDLEDCARGQITPC